MSRISILDKDRCQPKKCDYLCINYCPGVRMSSWRTNPQIWPKSI